jgi:hypothetical protein
MRDLLALLLHLLTTLARLLGPGGTRAVIAETLLIKHQLVILDRSRRRAPNLTAADRIVLGLCTLFMNPSRIRKVAAALKPSTLLAFHRALKDRKYRRLFSPQHRGKPGPKGPSKELVQAILEMKRRNPRYGCPRIAQQLSKAFGNRARNSTSARAEVASCDFSKLEFQWPSVALSGQMRTRTIKRRRLADIIGIRQAKVLGEGLPC